jgi:hypothetical protein
VDKGDLTKVVQVNVTPNDSNPDLTTEYRYEDVNGKNYGNVTAIIDGNGKRTDIEYDGTYQTFPRIVTHPQVGTDPAMTTVTEYLAEWGVPDEVTDVNGQITNYDYDGLGHGFLIKTE